jgi:hypothetical protein
MAPPKTPKRSAKARLTRPDVDDFLAGLDHPLKADIERVRKLILNASPVIEEGIKWNAPSFRKKDWFATFHLRSRDRIELVLHTGAKAKNNPEFKIPDPKGLIRWLDKDRCLVTLGAGQALKANARAFEAILKAWLMRV